MKFIPTAQKVYTDEELEEIMNEVIRDFYPMSTVMSDEEVTVKYANFEISEALLSYGDDEGITLMHNLAALPYNKNSSAMLEFLIAHGANVNVKDQKGNTPLHYCLRETAQLTDTAKLLIDNKADINAENFSGKSPLYYVLKPYSGMDTAMEMVANYGAKITPRIVRDRGYIKGFYELRNTEHQLTNSNKLTAFENDVKELKSEVSALRSGMEQVIELLKGMQSKNDNADENQKQATTSVRMFGK